MELTPLSVIHNAMILLCNERSKHEKEWKDLKLLLQSNKKFPKSWTFSYDAFAYVCMSFGIIGDQYFEIREHFVDLNK